jgi:uncharacterized pyridoxal phosphate-containing UPF0001 family protein
MKKYEYDIIQQVIYQNPTSNKLEDIAESIVKKYTNKQLSLGMKKNVEISIKCDEYYIIE